MSEWGVVTEMVKHNFSDDVQQDVTAGKALASVNLLLHVPCLVLWMFVISLHICGVCVL